VIHTYEKDEHGEEVLKKLAEATGGSMLEVKGMDKLTAALDEISDETVSDTIRRTGTGTGNSGKSRSSCVKKTRKRHAVRKMKVGPL
jgi:hypothetical protein